MKLSIGKELVSKGYKMQTFFFEKKEGSTTYLYEYTVFMERVDTFKFTGLWYLLPLGA